MSRSNSNCNCTRVAPWLLDEVMALSDRILVMFQGRIVGEVAGDQADERTLGLMMAGAHA